MTAKDEDILTNQTLLKKGLAIERLLQNVLSNNNVDPSTLLIGDRNAILVAARATGYGPEYKTRVTCPSCAEQVNYNFSLDAPPLYAGDNYGDKEITSTPHGTFVVQLPLTKVNVEMRLLTGRDEMNTSAESRNKKSTVFENVLTSQLEQIVVSLNDETDRAVIARFIDLMPAYDSRYLRESHTAVTPNIDLTQAFVCSSCDHEQKLGVPFTADFFWPNR